MEAQFTPRGDRLDAFQDRHRVQKPDESRGGVSFAKLFAEGSGYPRAYVTAVEPTGEPTTPHRPPLDRQKLDGVLTLEDLNRRRAEVGRATSLSDADFEVLKARTKEDFSAYTSDPVMNYRRNLYIMWMAEFIPTGLEK